MNIQELISFRMDWLDLFVAQGTQGPTEALTLTPNIRVESQFPDQEQICSPCSGSMES